MALSTELICRGSVGRAGQSTAFGSIQGSPSLAAAATHPNGDGSVPFRRVDGLGLVPVVAGRLHRAVEHHESLPVLKEWLEFFESSSTPGSSGRAGRS